MTGFFDSGFGGLCILEAFLKECPEEPTVYIADNGNCPYGNKSAAEICALAERHTLELINDYGCDLVVIACNTATAAAIDYLREKYPHIKFVGLEPAIKPAALNSKTGVVGVIATKGTFNGRLYKETSAKFGGGVTILTAVADEWVALVEAGLENDAQKCRPAIEKVVLPLVKAGADHLVLGCTHFPHLKKQIAAVAGPEVTILDPAPAVARRAKSLL